MPFFALLLADLAAAAPFVTSWRTTTANEIIELPTIHAQSDLTIDWGDLTSAEPFASGDGVLTHTYAAPNTYTVSIEGQFYWDPSYCRPITASTLQLVDIVSWGDGIGATPQMFAEFPNLQVSAPPNTQPAFTPGTSLGGFFSSTPFNSSLDWDLLNVTDIAGMFGGTPLNQPITFSNTQGVQSISSLFAGADQFNQPFHFDASSVTSASYMFLEAFAFNSILNLTNASLLADTANMFEGATSFNQPITFNTDAVETMDSMFNGAYRFNQPVAFNTSRVTSMNNMFRATSSFNQPINFNSPLLISAAGMFLDAASFNQPVVMNTSSVTNMNGMFSGASSFASTLSFTSTAEVVDMDHMFDGANLFTQDLSAWDTGLVTQCDGFCLYCGLSAFPSCDPCATRFTNEHGVDVCYTRAPTTLSPTAAPTTAAPTAAPSVAPTVAPSVAPTTAAPSVAPSVASSVAPSLAPSAAPPAAVSPAAVAAVPSLAGLLLVLALGFRL